MINRRSISALALSGVLALGAAGTATARHGNDDPPSHDARDDHGGKRGGKRNDDSKAHGSRHRGRHRHGGNDDGPNHT